MYKIDRHDRVVELPDMSLFSIGAPCPLILQNDDTLILAFYVEPNDEAWDGTTVRIVGSDTEGELAAIVRFRICLASMFGPPNDETSSGHPLSRRGLESHSANVIENSSWIRSLIKMNSVNPYHNPDNYKRYKHFVFTFKESTFECVADGYEIYTKQSSISSLLPEMYQLLTGGGE